MSSLKSRSSTMEFRNDFRRVDKECQFSRCVQGYPRYGSASISPYKEYNLPISTLIPTHHGLRSSHVISYHWLHLHSHETRPMKIKQMPTDLYLQLANLRTEKRDKYLWKPCMHRCALARCRFKNRPRHRACNDLAGDVFEFRRKAGLGINLLSQNSAMP